MGDNTAVSGGYLWGEQQSDEAVIQNILHQQQKSAVGVRQMPRATLDNQVSFYIPPNQPQQSQANIMYTPAQPAVPYMDTTSLFSNNRGGFGQQQQQSYTGGGGYAQPIFQDAEVIMSGWAEMDLSQKADLIASHQATYKSSLAQHNMDITDQYDAKLAVEDENLMKKYKTVVNSQQIEELLDGCAIPGYARVVAKTIPTITVNFNVNSSAVLYDYSKFPQVVDTTFKSFNAYGQGDDVSIKYDPTLSPIPLGNLTNTFICKITLKHVINCCEVPISVEFGETHGGKFMPYSESMLHRTPGEGARCHFVVPPKYKGDCNFVVMTNSKEVSNPFAYLYSSLTADEKVIRAGDKGTVEDERGVPVVRYPLNHPIARYVATEGIKEGWVQYTLDPKNPAIVEIRKTVVDRAVERIREMVLQKFPTRDLTKFTIKLTRLTKTGLVRDPDFARVDDTVPFYMTYEMLYLFRDLAEQQTQNLRMRMR